jgi:hypothetical protein
MALRKISAVVNLCPIRLLISDTCLRRVLAPLTRSYPALNNAVILQFLEQGFDRCLDYHDCWDGK